MWLKLRQKIERIPKICLIAPSVTLLAIAATYTGIFQFLELSCLDYWFRFRPIEAKESRIVVITISESDISQLGQWPIADRKLAELITKVKQQQPRAIGLDIYRDLPVEPGYDRLKQVFTSTPNLIGVEKAVGEKVKPSSILAENDRVALADLVEDVDSKVRRGLLSIRDERGEIKLGLAAKLALIYLDAEGINLNSIEGTDRFSLGKTVITPFKSNDGGYIRADNGGFQILLNYRGTKENFLQVSILEVLRGEIPANLMQDRLVLIGSTAQSLNDLFHTPFSSNSDFPYMEGVFVHANIISSILSSSLENRPQIKVLAEPSEWLWILSWSFFGAGMSLILLQNNFQLNHNNINIFIFFNSTFFYLLLPGIIILASGYLLFLQGWWLPVITPWLAAAMSSLTTVNYYYQQEKNLAFIDSLTKVANRRLFDRYLQQQWQECQKEKKALSLILCDVDFFKKYNDTYGHQAGDKCLQQVAAALKQAIRDRDLVARYGGEEFVIILPATTADKAMLIVQRICTQINSLEIEHSSSQASDRITLSCGVASLIQGNLSSPEELIAAADRALYEAKAQGRDRAVLFKN